MTFLLVFICIVLSGLLSAAEIAFVTARRSQIRSLAKSGHKQATVLRYLRDNPERTLSVIQLGESFVSVLAATVGFIGTAEYLTPYLVENLGLSSLVAQALSVFVVVVGLTYIDVVFGELVPKVLALRHPLWVATLTSHPLLALERALRPFVSFLEWSTRAVIHSFLRAKHWKPTEENESEFDFEALPDAHRHLVLNAVALEKRRIQEIYLPWENVISLNWNQSFEDVANIVGASPHSRLPVVKDGKLEGILTNRDFVACLLTGKRDWHSLLRKVARVQQSTTLLSALKMLQGRRNQLAVIYNGSEIIGIITMRDIFEQIVGDIYDEDDVGALKHILGRDERYPIALNST